MRMKIRYVIIEFLNFSVFLFNNGRKVLDLLHLSQVGVSFFINGL